MGANCCCSNSQNPSSFAQRNASEKKYLLYHFQKIDPYEYTTAKHWKEILKEVLLEIGNPHKSWAPFKNGFLHLLKSSQSILNPSVISSISSCASHIEDNNQTSQRSPVPAEAPLCLELSQPAQERETNIIQSTQGSGIGQTSHEVIPKSARRQSGKEKIRLKLMSLLDQDKGVVLRLVREFHRKFREQFGKHLKDIHQMNHSQRIDKLYARILRLIKEFFLKIIKSFIRKSYEPFMKKAEILLRKEDYEPEYILESVVYELLFRDPNTTFNKLVLALLAKKHAERTNKFNKILEERKNESLPNDPILSDKFYGFLLQGNNMPYQEICDDYADIQRQTNPYTKFEIISSLWNKILKIAREYHKDNPEVESQLEREFDEDIRFQIMTYCIVKSQNKELVVDEMLIAGFVGERYQNLSKKFSWFRAYMMWLMEETELIE